MKGLIIAVAVALSPLALADSKPTAEHKPLSVIVLDLEKQGYLPVEVDYDFNRWDVEVWKGNEKRKLKIDAKTGEVISDILDR